MDTTKEKHKDNAADKVMEAVIDSMLSPFLERLKEKLNTDEYENVKKYSNDMYESGINFIEDIREISVKDDIARYFRILTRNEKSMDLAAKHLNDLNAWTPPYNNCFITFEKDVRFPEYDMDIFLVHVFRYYELTKSLFIPDALVTLVVDGKPVKFALLEDVIKSTGLEAVQFVFGVRIGGKDAYIRFITMQENVIAYTNRGWETFLPHEIPPTSDLSYAWAFAFFMMYTIKHPIIIRKQVNAEIKKIKERQGIVNKQKKGTYNRAKPSGWMKKKHERILAVRNDDHEKRDYTKPDYSFDRAAHIRHYYYCPHNTCKKRVFAKDVNLSKCPHCGLEVSNWKVVEKFINTHTVYADNEIKHNKHIEYEE